MLPPNEWIERAIRVNTVTDRSNGPMVRFLAPLCREAGLTVREQTVTEGGVRFTNLIAFNRAPDAPGLLVLNTHLDTVSAGDRRDWTRTKGDPFRATRVGDRLYGLGTADVKLDFLCKLQAARLARSRWKRPFALVGTYGEERGLVGAAKLLGGGRVRPKMALVGEPSDLQLIYAHKGHLIAHVSFPLGRAPRGAAAREWRGEAAHSSTPHLGDNAILKALRAAAKEGLAIHALDGGTDTNRVPDRASARISRGGDAGTRWLLAFAAFLETLAVELAGEKDRRFSPSSPTVSLNLARTRGSRVDLWFDVRLLPATDADRLKRLIPAAVRNLGGRCVGIVHDAALSGDRQGPLMRQAGRAMRTAGIKVVAATKATSTEAALYQQAGAEAIVFGPGVSVGNVHRPNEHNLVSQMEAAVRFYSEILSMPAEEA